MARDSESLTDEERRIIAAEIAEMPSRPTDLDECPLRDLVAGQIPFCPWVGCRYHLYLDVKISGSIRFNFPDLEVWEIPETCALRVALGGEMSMAKVGSHLGLCRERVRQLFEATARRLRRMLAFRQLALNNRSRDRVTQKDHEEDQISPPASPRKARVRDR